MQWISLGAPPQRRFNLTNIEKKTSSPRGFAFNPRLPSRSSLLGLEHSRLAYLPALCKPLSCIFLAAACQVGTKGLHDVCAG